MADQELICAGAVMSGAMRGWGTRWLLSVGVTDLLLCTAWKHQATHVLQTSSAF